MNIKNLQIDHFNKIQRFLVKFTEKFLNDFCIEFLSLLRWHKSYNLLRPKTFNEKIHWLKLFNRNIFYNKLVDKLLVKEYISNKVGSKYIIKTFGSWKKTDDIPWDKLPNSFVIKTNHASGSTFLVRNKKNDVNKKLIESLNEWMKRDFYKISREYVYKEIERKIIVEELLLNDKNQIPKDYKFFCFNGKPKFIQIDLDRFQNHKRAFYTIEWDKLPFTCLYEKYEYELSKPNNLEEMIKISKILSKDLIFIRVDLYEVLGKIYFGELTFFPGGGNEQFYPRKWDKKIGKMLDLSNLN